MYTQKLALGRNDPCWCDSGVKFKKCHGSPDAIARHDAGKQKWAG